MARYIAQVEADTDTGRETLCVANEGFGAVRGTAGADLWRNKRDAEAAGRFYVRICNEAARELGWEESARYIGVATA